jgi:hypothetical protein
MTQKRKPVAVGDLAQIGAQKVRVIEPYKVTGMWRVVVEEGSPRDIGEEMIMSGGTIALHRVKK